ncbi:hypothetical protein Ccrd_006698 [Cynara cardunculus var. scolymus]|uniref:Uncharacterized protein n=1 Tax=Cynara cardunculus var. scolymus TaxID=59895 RepID=A0A103XIP8_CYNCS|nr:hypothetical protein Ccrd_006698 [Cynara cardunculus var. scolymus]
MPYTVSIVFVLACQRGRESTPDEMDVVSSSAGLLLNPDGESLEGIHVSSVMLLSELEKGRPCKIWIYPRSLTMLDEFFSAENRKESVSFQGSLEENLPKSTSQWRFGVSSGSLIVFYHCKNSIISIVLCKGFELKGEISAVGTSGGGPPLKDWSSLADLNGQLISVGLCATKSSASWGVGLSYQFGSPVGSAAVYLFWKFHQNAHSFEHIILPPCPNIHQPPPFPSDYRKDSLDLDVGFTGFLLAFGSYQLFFICMLRSISSQINIDDLEVQANWGAINGVCRTTINQRRSDVQENHKHVHRKDLFVKLFQYLIADVDDDPTSLD